MGTVFQPEAPLRVDESGAIRVGETRVLMVLVIEAFQDGATPEGIVLQYDSLDLGDVYLVIGYYLRHKAEVEEYIADYNRQADEVRTRIEAGQKDLPDIRSRLLARRRKGQSGGGTVGAS